MRNALIVGLGVALALCAGCQREAPTAPVPAGGTAGASAAAVPSTPPPAPAAAAPAATARPRIALIMKSLANDFFATMAKGAEAHHAAHAAAYDLAVSGIKNETDLGGQVDLVEQAVAQGAAAIVIAPANSKALVPALRRAQQQGVVVVNIDNRLDPDVSRQAGLVAGFVGPDNRAGAYRVGKALAAHLHPGDEVAVIEGITTAFNGQERSAGFQAAMHDAGMKIVAVQSGDWEIDKANAITANLLTAHPQLKAVLCANDNMALGAAAAIGAAGRTGKVLLAGFDNISAVQPLLADGRLLATADQHAGELAVYGIEAALQALADHRPGADRTSDVDLIAR